MHIYLAMGIGGGRGSDSDAWNLDMTDEVSGFVRNWRLENVGGIGEEREGGVAEEFGHSLASGRSSSSSDRRRRAASEGKE